jgi:hypothetical protein
MKLGFKTTTVDGDNINNKIKSKNNNLNLDLDLVKFANILENEFSRNSSSGDIKSELILQVVDRMTKMIPEKVKNNLEFYRSLPEQLTERQKILLCFIYLQQQESGSGNSSGII